MTRLSPRGLRGLSYGAAIIDVESQRVFFCCRRFRMRDLPDRMLNRDHEAALILIGEAEIREHFNQDA